MRPYSKSILYSLHYALGRLFPGKGRSQQLWNCCWKHVKYAILLLLNWVSITCPFCGSVNAHSSHRPDLLHATAVFPTVTILSPGLLELSSSAANTGISRGVFMQTGDLIDFVGLAGLKWEQSPCLGLLTQHYENRARCHRCGYIIRMCRGEVIQKIFFFLPYFLEYWWYKQFAVANISNSFWFYRGVFYHYQNACPLTFYSINPSWFFSLVI